DDLQGEPGIRRVEAGAVPDELARAVIRADRERERGGRGPVEAPEAERERGAAARERRVARVAAGGEPDLLGGHAEVDVGAEGAGHVEPARVEIVGAATVRIVVAVEDVPRAVVPHDAR